MLGHGTMSTSSGISIAFTKATGAGNDFVVIDNMDRSLGADPASLARAVCDRHFGVGGDGLLLVEPSARADFMMKYYNADGSYGGMCGNGGRCISRFAVESGICLPEATFEALDHVYAVRVTGDEAMLTMKNPVDFQSHLTLVSETGSVDASFVNTGSPHAVIEVPDLESLNVVAEGRRLRYNTHFQPDGANVNFFRCMEGTHVWLRTYERGVEDETLACGTGSVATALIAAQRHGLRSPVDVHVRSGETLTVHFEGTPNEARNVRLEGSARLLFSGILEYDETTGRIAL
jgi:diaminopimelate epimerase